MSDLDPRLPATWGAAFEANPTRDAWAIAQALTAPPLSQEQVRRLAPLLADSPQRTTSTENGATRTAS